MYINSPLRGRDLSSYNNIHFLSHTFCHQLPSLYIMHMCTSQPRPQSVWDSPRGGEACTSHSFQKVLLHTFMIDRDTHFYLSSFIEHSMKLFMFRKLTRL